MKRIITFLSILAAGKKPDQFCFIFDGFNNEILKSQAHIHRVNTTADLQNLFQHIANIDSSSKKTVSKLPIYV